MTLEEKQITFDYRDRELNRVAIELHDWVGDYGGRYHITIRFSGETIYTAVVLQFDGMILRYYPDRVAQRRESLLNIGATLAKWFVLTGRHTEFEVPSNGMYKTLRLSSVGDEPPGDFSYKDEQSRITLVHPLIGRSHVEEHQIARLAIAETLYDVESLEEDDFYRRVSMPNQLVKTELTGMENSRLVRVVTRRPLTIGVEPSVVINLTLEGRRFYEESRVDRRALEKSMDRNKSGVAFIVAACEHENRPGQGDVIATYKHVARSLGLDPKFQEHEEPMRNIHADIFDYLDSCDIVIADLTYERLNCYIEIGYALARQKPIVLFIENKWFDTLIEGRVPFDVALTKYEKYSRDDLPALESRCRDRVKTHLDRAGIGQ